MKRFIYNQLVDYKWHLLDKAAQIRTDGLPYSAKRVRLEKKAYSISSIAWKYFS